MYEDRFKPMQKVKWNCIVSLYVLCKEEYIEEVEQIADLLGSLKLLLLPLCLFGGLLHVLDAETCNITSFKNKRA